MNRHAQALGRLAKGKKKTLSEQEIQNRKDRLSEARKLRWPIEKANTPQEDAGTASQGASGVSQVLLEESRPTVTNKKRKSRKGKSDPRGEQEAL